MRTCPNSFNVATPATEEINRRRQQDLSKQLAAKALESAQRAVMQSLPLPNRIGCVCGRIEELTEVIAQRDEAIAAQSAQVQELEKTIEDLRLQLANLRVRRRHCRHAACTRTRRRDAPAWRNSKFKIAPRAHPRTPRGFHSCRDSPA